MTLTAARPATRPGTVLAVLLTGQFMAVLDLTIVNIAAPDIRADLGASGSGLQLVVAGYTVAYAVLLITGARLGDRLGHGRVFRAGLAGFTLASAACAVAPTTGTLIGFRFAQGAAAAAMMPQVMSLIQRVFAGPARARALSLYAAVIAVGTVVGQVAGGLLVGADLLGTGWRPAFALNVPVGVVLLALCGRLPFDRGDADRKLDPAGVGLLSAAVLALVLPLVLGREQGWPVWTWVSLLASVVLLAAFARAQRSVPAPLVPAALLRAPGMVPGAVAQLLGMAAYGGYLFVLTLHLQNGLGESPARAGLTFAPAAVGFAATGLTWRRLPAGWHTRIIPAGLAVAAVGYLTAGLLLRDGRSGGWPLALDLLVLGLALGLAVSPILAVALARVPVALAADASGLLVSLFQLGIVIGVATLGTLYLTLLPADSALVRTALAIAGTTLLAALAALPLIRSRQ
jgi:MFS family permease